MTRGDLVLALLASAEGRTFTPVQLQKACFLVTENMRNLVDDGPNFNFVPYDYGPFDSAVYTEAQQLAAVGDAIIAPSGYGRWNTYAASAAGTGRGRTLLDALAPRSREYVEQVGKWVRSLSFSSLVKSIYEAYPHTRANSVFRG